jgi:hypothetical protein
MRLNLGIHTVSGGVIRIQPECGEWLWAGHHLESHALPALEHIEDARGCKHHAS